MRLKRFTFKLKPETTLGQIWEAIRQWIEGSPYSRFKGLRMLPTKITEGEFDWESKGDRVTLSRVGEGMRIESERTRRGLRWRNDLAFERGKKAVKCVIEMHIVGSVPDGPVELKEPKIVKRLKKTYGIAEPKDEKPNVKSEKKRPYARRTQKKRQRAGLGELTQKDVAKDFGVSRKTVNRWEREQTVDGPDNTSNPWGYYKSLRLRSDLRDAYEMLVNLAKAYLKMRRAEMAKGHRFKITFESFNEFVKKHNQRL